jgi:histidinol-phosphate aminotransferase
LTSQITALSNHGLRAVPSAANFVLVIFDGAVAAKTADRELVAAGYVVRHLAGQGLGHALRITIGTEEENRGFMEALRHTLEKAR